MWLWLTETLESEPTGGAFVLIYIFILNVFNYVDGGIRACEFRCLWRPEASDLELELQAAGSHLQCDY